MIAGTPQYMSPEQANGILQELGGFELGNFKALLTPLPDKLTPRLAFIFPEPNEISVSQLVNDINSDKVKKITVSGDSLAIVYNDDKKAQSMKESNSVLPDLLANLGVQKDKLQKIEISATLQQESVWSWLLPALI